MKKTIITVIITALSVFVVCLGINEVVETRGVTRVESFEFVSPPNELLEENIPRGGVPEVQGAYVVNQIDNSEAFTYSPQGEEMLIVHYDDGTFSCTAKGPNNEEQGDYGDSVEPGLE